MTAHPEPAHITARRLRARATAICKQAGAGQPGYRGDPLEAVALQQEAQRISPR